MSRVFRAFCAAAASACIAAPLAAYAQEALPEIVITTDPSGSSDGGALTVPTTSQAAEDIQRTPGAVEVVPDHQFKDGPANTIWDILGWVPGVITQPKSNVDNRVSIRGSGLTRNYGNRGINLYMDGIPINTSDGLFDVFEIDPSAYRYVEVFKGANALRFGGNALGGAINFVTPTGRDAKAFDGRFDVGSFGFARGQVSGRLERAVRLVRDDVGAARKGLPRSQRWSHRARQRQFRLPTLAPSGNPLLP